MIFGDDSRLKTQSDIIKTFSNWDSTASVRSAENIYDLSGIDPREISGRFWFLPNAMPYLQRPEVKDLGDQISQTLLARYLIFFLDYTTLLEIRIVNQSIQSIALDLLDLSLSNEIKLTGMKLYADEAYHAVMSAQVANQVAQMYGVRNREAAADKINAMEHLVWSAPPEHHALAWYIMGFVSETVITKEFLKISQKVIVEPVYNMLKDHLEDEFRHSLYFSHTFKLVWNMLRIL